MKILVVDDSPTYVEMLSQTLRRDGCQVISASSGEEALTRLATEQVDCVIMDLVMPGIDGMEAARRIKRAPALAHIPVIILTGLDDANVRQQGFAIGVDDFVIKSPELPLLNLRLHKLGRKRSAGSASVHLSSPGLAAEGPAGDPAIGPHAEMRAQAEDPGALFEQVLAASGLSSVIGRATLSRAFRRAGVDPMSMSPAELSRALPSIQEALCVFLSEEECRRGIAAMASLAKSAT